MIIKIFSTKGGATSAVNYFLSKKDHKGNLREVKPEILRGDAQYTKDLDGLTKKYAHQIVSGVISFRDNETLTPEQKEKLLDDFEDTFIGSEMKEKVNSFFVEHYDKGNLEIHFVINRVAIMENGKHKHFNPFPPGHEKLKDAFVSLKNEEYGFEQIEEKAILKTKYTGAERKAIRSGKHNFENLKTKFELDKAMREMVKSGEVKNREELIDILKSSGHTLSRIGDDYISIKNDNGRNMRFRGGIYAHNEGKDYQDIIDLFKEKSKTKIYCRKTTLQTYHEEMSKRVSFNSKRYQVEDDPLGYEPVSIVKVDNRSSPISNQKVSDSKIEFELHSKLTNKNHSISDASPVFKSSAKERLSDALAELANARTPSETAKAQKAVAMAKALVERENAENKLRLDRIYQPITPKLH
ncbi:relaxase/mobilization nuclease domain-containing protein [Candidimonas humi]|uniref:Relaxase/mobilization nuclease domain-containing protein n=1 Tax=Candidimonas humi TaxID=683355 RepID=A0ABV8P4I4_9BURK|nr:relaxase/mobilization nuclease domain-containing protein [Candidimonas humi]MBV6307361.1 relaxase/mobilization nuclease domain-containing protein [Candidimonas humi]